MFNLKQIPEDFKVKETINLKLLNKGGYKCYLLKKKNFTTNDAISLLSKKFRINFKDFGYAGNKDKKALTEQFISIKTNRDLKNFNFENIFLEFKGHLSDKIHLGNNLGNEFEIVVRNLSKKYAKINEIVNYFDEQRFSKNNVLIGKLLLQRKFKEICNLLDVNNLNKLSKKELRFYLHSYQSYLFNKAASTYLKKYKNYKKVEYSLGEFIFPKKSEKLKFPLISFDFKSGKKDKINLDILNSEGIKLDQFIVREHPWLIEETTYRDVFVKVKNFKTLKYIKDDLNSGKFKQIIKFSLPKGSYATILVKQMFD